MYIALIIDVKNSKKYDSVRRVLVQNHIKICMAALNEIFKPIIEKPIVFSGGDEIQGLFKSLPGALLYLKLFAILAFPIQIKAGLGLGQWDVIMNDGLSTEQDGTAYHNARDALKSAHDSGINDIYVFSHMGKEEALSALINNLHFFISRHTEIQNIILSAAEYIYPIEYAEELEMEAYGLLAHVIIQKKTLFETIDFSFDEVCPRAPTAIKKIDRDMETEVWKWGSAVTIAGSLGKTRQSVEKSIKTGNMPRMRYQSGAMLLLAAQVESKRCQL